MRRGWLCVALVLGLPASRAPAETSLKWKLKEGDRFYLEEKVLQKQTLKVMGSDLRQELAFTRVTRFTVLKKTDAGIVLEVKTESVRFSRPKDQDKAEPRLVQGLEGATLKVTLDAHLRVTRLEGYEEVVKKIAGKEDVGKMIRALLPEEALARGVEAVFVFLPDKPVAAGAEWSHEVVRPLGPLGALKVDNAYTLKGPVKGEPKDVVRIDVAAVKSTYVPPKGGDEAFQVARGEIKADRPKTRGSLFFDAARGRLVKADRTVQLEGSLTVAGMGKPINLDLEQEETVAALDAPYNNESFSRSRKRRLV